METSQVPDSPIPVSRVGSPVLDNAPSSSAAPWTGRASFRARRWMSGGHVQTIASFLLPRRIQLPAPEERLVEVEPGIKIRCWCYWQDEARRREALTLIVVHGLEGSSD